MSLLEKVIFTADFTSEERTYSGVATMRKKSKKSLEEAMLYGYQFTFKDLSKRQLAIHPDELPDEFIKILRKEVKSVKPDAVIIGEVWEDASNKVAYSKQREYLLGDELDSVMNYPFKDNITAYVMGWKSAEKINAALMSIYENYPIEVLYSLMNLLGTHDTMRIKSLFGALYIAANYIKGISFKDMKLLNLLPYVVTVIVLVLTSVLDSKNAQPPAALGLNYFREDR